MEDRDSANLSCTSGAARPESINTARKNNRMKSILKHKKLRLNVVSNLIMATYIATYLDVAQ